MSYSNKEKNSYQDLEYPKERMPIAMLNDSLRPNDISKKYTKQIMCISNSIFKAKTILSQLNGNYNKIFDTAINDENKKILEKHTLIQKTQDKMKMLNLLLKLLEKSSKSVYTDTQHLSLSQSAYNYLEAVYLDDPNNVASKNELMNLKNNGFIKIVDFSIYYSTFCEEVHTPYLAPGPSRMLDIINISAMKDRICSIMDRDETIIPWTEEIESLFKLIENAKINKENTPLKEMSTTLDLGKSTNDSKHVDVEQSLPDDNPLSDTLIPDTYEIT